MNDALKLLPSQEQHAARLRNSLQRYGCALDASVPGAGKTYVAQPADIFDALPHSETSAPDEGTWTGGDLPGITAEDFITACTTVDIGKLEDFFVARAKHGFKGSMKTALSCWLTERNLMRPASERRQSVKTTNPNRPKI